MILFVNIELLLPFGLILLDLLADEFKVGEHCVQAIKCRVNDCINEADLSFCDTSCVSVTELTYWDLMLLLEIALVKELKEK